MRYPVDTSHMSIVQSADPYAKYFPFGEKAKLNNLELWPLIRII